MMRREEFFAEWSSLHGGAKIEGIVQGWLKISFQLAKFLQALRVTPNSLTSIGVLFAVALYLVATFSDLSNPINLIFIFLLLALSLIADGVDGSLAIIGGTGTRFGAAWDAIADRITESSWALVFIVLGADFRLVLVVWLLACIQEYIRARSGGLGVSEIGIVTICERPVRASILAIAITAQLLSSFISVDFQAPSPLLSNAFTLVWLLMQSVSVVMLWRKTTVSLRQLI